jgi:hypothetical protein
MVYSEPCITVMLRFAYGTRSAINERNDMLYAKPPKSVILRHEGSLFGLALPGVMPREILRASG